MVCLCRTHAIADTHHLNVFANWQPQLARFVIGCARKFKGVDAEDTFISVSCLFAAWRVLPSISIDVLTILQDRPTKGVRHERQTRSFLLQLGKHSSGTLSVFAHGLSTRLAKDPYALPSEKSNSGGGGVRTNKTFIAFEVGVL
jgi:hypothetical protein